MESPLGPDLSKFVKMWRNLIDYKLKPLELTQTHWITLHNIHQLPPEQSQIQLAKTIGIEQPSLVRTLDQLEEKGLITRHTCINDRRAKRIKLTESAKPIIKKINDIVSNIKSEIFYDIKEQDIEILNTIIIKLEKNILKLFNTS